MPDAPASLDTPTGHAHPRVQIVAFRLDDDRYGIPLDAAERVLAMVALSPLPGAPDVVLGAVNIHGDVVPVLDVRRRLGLPSGELGPSARLLVARTRSRRVALPVDAVAGLVEIPSADISARDSVLPGLEHVAGVAALADGLLLIQDIDAFFSIDEERQVAEALGEEPA